MLHALIRHQVVRVREAVCAERDHHSRLADDGGVTGKRNFLSFSSTRFVQF